MSGIASLLGGGAPKPVPLASLPKPERVAIPSQTDPASLEARRKALEAAAGRKGRASTILTSPIGTAPVYSNTLLGE